MKSDPGPALRAKKVRVCLCVSVSVTVSVTVSVSVSVQAYTQVYSCIGDHLSCTKDSKMLKFTLELLCLGFRV
jgi:hypothetical protein